MVRTRQPQGAVRINATGVNSAAQFVVCGQYAASRALQFGSPSSSSGSGIGATPEGIGYKFGGGSTEYARFDTNFLLAAASACSIEFVVYGSSFPSLAQLFGLADSATTNGGITANGGAERAILSFNGGPPCNIYGWGGSNDSDSGVAFQTNVRQHVIAVKPPGAGVCDWVFYRNGVYLATFPSSNGSAYVATGPYFYLGGRHPSGAGSITGTIPLAVFHDRALTAAEVAQRFGNPYSVVVAPSRRVWVQLEPASGVQDATVNATGVSATTALGTPTVTTSGTITVNATGVSATTALGTTTQTYTASVAATGVSSTTALGTVSVTSTTSYTATGVSATAALGTTTQTYSGSVAETGVAATGQLGTTTQTYSGQVAATGVSTTSALGTVSVTTTAGITVSPTGVAATTALGTVSTTYTASVAATGVAGATALGTVSVTTTASVNVSATGVAATSALGTPTVTTTASVTVNATGVVATSAVGTVSASGVSPQVAAPTADIAAGGWQSTGASLYEVLDETTQNDSDYIYSPNNPTTEQFEIMFASLVDPQSSAGHTIRLGLQAIGQDTTFTFKLVQGTTVLDTWDETVTAGTTATRPHTLSGIVADSISNYSDLRLRGVAHA